MAIFEDLHGWVGDVDPASDRTPGLSEAILQGAVKKTAVVGRKLWCHRIEFAAVVMSLTLPDMVGSSGRQ